MLGNKCKKGMNIKVVQRFSSSVRISHFWGTSTHYLPMFLVPPNVRNALVTLTWFPVMFTAFDHLYQPCQISGMSMAPTFNPATESTTKDVVLVQKHSLLKPGALSRGDIVMFRSPGDPEKLVTKRIVGVQGDLILPRATYPRSQARVPRNHLWVEGDNAFHSVDSNNFGPISQALVVGKVVSILWPVGRMGAILEGGRDARKRSVAAIDDL